MQGRWICLAIMKLLNIYSYVILVLISLLGYGAAVLYWKKADHTK